MVRLGNPKLFYVAAPEFKLRGRPLIRVPGSASRCPRACSGLAGASPSVAAERYLETFQICASCSMIEQESDEAGYCNRLPMARQACYETAAAISAMLVWTRPGHPLALPQRHRVRAVPVPALGAAALVAVVGLPAGPRELMAGHTRNRA